MLSSSIRTLVTSKAAISLATVALLGGGAALAAPGEVVPLDDGEELPIELPEPADDTDRDGTDGLDVARGGLERTRNITAFCEEEPDAAFCRGESEPTTNDEDEVTNDEDEVTNDEDEESEGNGWALGRRDAEQQDRVEAFCAARTAQAEATGSAGVPPFCTSNDGEPEPPNAFGQRTAEAARGAELAEDDDAERNGPPPWARRGDRTQDGSRIGDAPDADTEVERAGPPARVPAGPPAGVPGRGRG